MELTENHIRYGIDHSVNQPPNDRDVVEVSEYRGEETLTINCTQLGDSFTPHLSSPKEKRRVLVEWCDYLKAHPESFTELSFGTRVPQELFDAVCHQRRLVELRIKWGAYEDLSAIEGLSQLRLLHLGSGARVKSIAPLTKLEGLLALSVENFQKISDYSPLSKLRQLESLAISGDGLGPQYIKVDSLEFLRELTSLRFFSLLTERLSSKDYRPVLALRNLEHLTLRSSAREVKALHPELLELPHLKWGLIKEQPQLYRASKRA